MSNEKLEITMKCDQCDNVPPIDDERSSENWTVYETKESCECGGTFRIHFGNLI